MCAYINTYKCKIFLLCISIALSESLFGLPFYCFGLPFTVWLAIYCLACHSSVTQPTLWLRGLAKAIKLQYYMTSELNYIVFVF